MRREGEGQPRQGQEPACDDHELPNAESPGEWTGDERAKDAANATTCQDEAGRKLGCMLLLGKDEHDQDIPSATEVESTDQHRQQANNRVMPEPVHPFQDLCPQACDESTPST